MIQPDTRVDGTSLGQAGRQDHPNPFAFTDWTSAQVRESAHRYTCTCQFPARRQAVVHVIGASSQTHARDMVRCLWSSRIYFVLDGDLTCGHAIPFWLILEASSQEGATRDAAMQCDGQELSETREQVYHSRLSHY